MEISVAGLVPPYSVFISAVWMAVAPAPKQSYYEGANPDLLYRIPVNACVVMRRRRFGGGLQSHKS